MLELTNVRVSYDGVLAVSGVSLSVKAGQIVALVGGNGNGKSTTLRAIAGLNAVDAGTIVFENKAIHNIAAHRRVQEGLVLIPEGRRLFPRLSVERNLELGAFTRKRRDEIDATKAQVFDWFPILKERRNQIAGTMSGGEQQMLAIGRGLMGRPRLLMLDEPSWGIAPRFIAQVFETIRQVNASGVSILLVEQNLRQALELADFGYVIQTGRIVVMGSGAELLDNDEVRRAYLGL
jgi:branched-chain amino acid transport system ATP-binding protein